MRNLPPSPPNDPTKTVPPNKTAPRSPGGGAAAGGVPDRLINDPVPDPALSSDGDALKEHEAYAALATLATNIAETITEPVERGSVLIVQDSAGLAALATYREFRDRAALLANEYDAIVPTTDAPRAMSAPAAAPAMGALKGAVLEAGEILGGVAGIVALFKPQRRVSSRMFTASDESLAAEVSGYFARRAGSGNRSERRLRVYYPPLFPPDAVGAADALAEIGKVLEHVAQARRQAEARIEQMTEQDRHTARERLAALNARVSMMEASLFGGTKTDGTGSAPDDASSAADTHMMSQLVRGASRQRLLGDTGHLLFLKLLRLGGIEQEFERRLARDKDLYRGMAVATFFLFHADGTLVNARTERTLSRPIDRRDQG